MFYLYMRGKRFHNYESLSLLKFMIIQQGLAMDFTSSSNKVKKPFTFLFSSLGFIYSVHSFLDFYMGL